MRGLFGFAAGVIGLACATCLFWVGLAFEHRPAGWPNLRVDLWALHWTLRLPDGPWARLEAMQAAARTAKARSERVAKDQARISDAVGLGHAIAAERIRFVYRTITKEIRTSVTPDIDRSFPLPVGLLRVHDAAALGVPTANIPAPAGQPDDAASGVKASDLAAAITENYGACRLDAQTLTDLQDWVRRQSEAAK